MWRTQLEHGCDWRHLAGRTALNPYLMGRIAVVFENPPDFTDCSSTLDAVRLRGLDRLHLRLDPLLRRTFWTELRSRSIAPYVRQILGDVNLHRFEVMSETGLTEWPTVGDRPPSDGTVHLLDVGRLVRTKGLRDAIGAVERLRSSTQWCSTSLATAQTGLPVPGARYRVRPEV